MPRLCNKDKYVLRYEIFQLYLQLARKLKKSYRHLKLKQSQWLDLYNYFNYEKIRKIANDLGKNLFNSLN